MLTVSVDGEDVGCPQNGKVPTSVTRLPEKHSCSRPGGQTRAPQIGVDWVRTTAWSNPGIPLRELCSETPASSATYVSTFLDKPGRIRPRPGTPTVKDCLMAADTQRRSASAVPTGQRACQTLVDYRVRRELAITEAEFTVHGHGCHRKVEGASVVRSILHLPNLPGKNVKSQPRISVLGGATRG